MKKTEIILGIIALIGLTLTGCNKCKNSEEQKYFYETLNNNSTSPDFIVITVVDKKTKISKEICCESNIFQHTYIEDNTSNKDAKTMMDTYQSAIKQFDLILKSHSCDHIFYFTKDESLKNLGFYNYITDSLVFYSNAHTLAIIDSIKKNFKTDKQLLFKNFFKTYNIYLIHVLNKNGIFCGVDDESGSIIIRKIIK